MADQVRSIGNVLAPWPYLLFAAVFLVTGVPGGVGLV